MHNAQFAIRNRVRRACRGQVVPAKLGFSELNIWSRVFCGLFLMQNAECRMQNCGRGFSVTFLFFFFPQRDRVVTGKSVGFIL